MSFVRSLSLTVLACFGAPLPVIGQAAMTLPAGCSGFMTIQLENCTVLNHWRCTADADGTYWVATVDETQTETKRNHMNGLNFLRATYRSGQKVEVIRDNDPEDFRVLMETGIDTYDNYSRLAGQTNTTRTHGQSVLTGETVAVDGVLLHEVRSTSQFTSATGRTSKKVVMQYVMDGLPIWVPNQVLGDQPGEVVKQFGPVDFIWPEEDGFMSMVPKVNCNIPLS